MGHPPRRFIFVARSNERWRDPASAPLDDGQRWLVVYAVVTGDVEEALEKFSASTQSSVEFLLVVKTETEIYLTQAK
jgi:hypothetical protein